MIRLRADNLLFFGLSEENLRRLQQNEPIYFDLGPLGVPGMRLAIVYGKTELEIMHEYGIDQHMQRMQGEKTQ